MSHGTRADSETYQVNAVGTVGGQGWAAGRGRKDPGEAGVPGNTRQEEAIKGTAHTGINPGFR